MFTRKEVILLRKLLFSDNFQPGTKEHITEFLDRGKSTVTREFVDKLIDLSCLTFNGTANVKVGNRYDERPIYDRDRKRLKELWKQTEEYKLSYAIIDEDYELIV